MDHNVVDELAYRIFGNFFYKNKEKFLALKVKIRKSHISMSVDQYLASACIYSIIVGLIGGIFGAFLGLKTFWNPSYRLIHFLNSINAGFVEGHLYALGILNILFLFFFGFLAVFGLAYVCPYFQTGIRQACIDKSILSSVTYMYALTKGGVSIYDVFRSLSMYTHIFGTSAEEVSYIVRDMDYLGKDFISALNSAKERTSSELFKDFIDGLILVSSNKALIEYIKSKSEQYQDMVEMANRNFLRKLDVLAEVYVTVLVAGPLFVMTTLIVLQLFRPASAQILYLLIYVIIPLANLLFLVLLDMVGELSMDTEETNVSGFSIDFCDIPEISSGFSVEEEEKRSKKFLLYRKLNNLKNLLFSPYKTMRDKPVYSFFIGIPFGLYYLTHIPKSLKDDFISNFHLAINFTHISVSSIQLISEIQNYFIIFISIVLLPFIIFYEIRAWRMRKIDEKMPDLLRNLSNLNGSGILFSTSLKLMAESKMGILTKELKKLKEDMSWGTSTSRVLMKLGNNIKTATSSRVLHILIKANESTSDLKNVLLVTAEQVKSEEELKKERSSDMAVYVVTIYVAFFVFVFIVYILVLYFFPQSVSFTRSSLEVWCAGIGNESFNVKEYTMLMFHSTLIQAFLSGLVAGKMGQGSAYMGLKHSVCMIMIAYVVFMIFI